jgi:probable F420-dependent oxidoreductase
MRLDMSGEVLGVSVGLVGFPLGQLDVTVDAPAHETVPRIARAAEGAGFDFLCAQDHPMAPREWVGERETGKTWFEPWVTLAWAGAVTSRIKLCTDIIVLPYRSPFITAKAASSLDALSDGRLILGVAAGYLEREFTIIGAEFPRRGDWTDEAIEALKAAWTGEWFSFEGQFISAHDVAVSPRPVQQPRPPIWVGGNSMRALRRGIEHGDGWTPFLGDPVRIGAMLDRARATWGIPEGFSVAVPIRGGVYTEDGAGIDADSVRRQVDALVGIGVTHVRVGFRGPTLDRYIDALESFGEQILTR